jgi:hypothetical protein
MLLMSVQRPVARALNRKSQLTIHDSRFATAHFTITAT